MKFLTQLVRIILSFKRMDRGFTFVALNRTRDSVAFIEEIKKSYLVNENKLISFKVVCLLRLQTDMRGTSGKPQGRTARIDIA